MKKEITIFDISAGKDGQNRLMFYDVDNILIENEILSEVEKEKEIFPNFKQKKQQ